MQCILVHLWIWARVNRLFACVSICSQIRLTLSVGCLLSLPFERFFFLFFLIQFNSFQIEFIIKLNLDISSNLGYLKCLIKITFVLNSFHFEYWIWMWPNYDKNKSTEFRFYGDWHRPNRIEFELKNCLLCRSTYPKGNWNGINQCRASTKRKKKKFIECYKSFNFNPSGQNALRVLMSRLWYSVCGNMTGRELLWCVWCDVVWCGVV